MQEKEDGYEQLHVSGCPTWIKREVSKWGESQEPKMKMSPVVIAVLKKWIESGFTTPKIGETVQLKSQQEIEKQKRVDELLRQQEKIQQELSSLR